MDELCGMDLCSRCMKRRECPGCKQADGHPMGVNCVAAECVKCGGIGCLLELKEQLAEEIAQLHLPGLGHVGLHPLSGSYVNLEYRLPNGTSVKLLDDHKIYLGTQVEIEGSERCYGIVADEEYLLVVTYGCEGRDPKIIVYKKRDMTNA